MPPATWLLSIVLNCHCIIWLITASLWWLHASVRPVPLFITFHLWIFACSLLYTPNDEKQKKSIKNSKMKFSSKCQLKGMNGGQLGNLKLINVCLNLFPDFSNCKRTSRPYLKLISCYSIHGKIYLLTNQKKRWLSSTEHP